MLESLFLKKKFQAPRCVPRKLGAVKLNLSSPGGSLKWCQNIMHSLLYSAKKFSVSLGTNEFD